MSVEGHRVDGPRHGLRDLAEQATPGPWEVHGPEMDRGVEYFHVYRHGHDLEAMYLLPDDARLIALAPEMAVLLADTKDFALNVVCSGELGDKCRGWLGEDSDPLCPRCSLLARIEELEGKA